MATRRQQRGLDFNASGDWQQRGFNSQAAARSVSQQYGLMKQPGGGWGHPTMDQFQGIMTNMGHGPSQPVATPMAVGGERWMAGAGGLKFTGQPTDNIDARFKTPGLHADRTNIGYGGGPQPGRTPPGKVQGGPHGSRRQRQIPEGPGMPGFTPGAQAEAGGAPGGGLGFPQTPAAPPSFLPMTPQYEAGRRSADDQLMQQLQGYQNQQNLVAPAVNLQTNRLMTDQGYAGQKLNEDLANRGLYQSGVNPYLYERDISIPYGRAYQDLALGAGQQYGNLMGQTGEAYGDYGSALTELMLNRAAQAAQQLPLSLPQFYPPTGPRNVTRKSRPRSSKKAKSAGRRSGNRGK